MYKLSIIIPIYGVENYLKKCLDSVYCQITPECQVILVDDESPDRCGEICDEYKERFPECTVVIHQKNLGLGGARNSGINAATGEYLFFIDSDDYIAKDAVATLLKAIADYSADVYIFPLQTVDESYRNLEIYKDNEPCFTPLNICQNKQILIGYPNACGKVAKANLYRDNGIFFPSKVWYEDIRTVPKMITKTQSIVYLDKPLYFYLQRDGSIMNNAKVDRNSEMIDALEDLICWFKKEGIYEEYREELDFLLIDHVFVSATVRVLRSAGSSHPLVKTIRSYTLENIAEGAFNNNKYVAFSMPKNRKLIMKLLKAKMYSAVKLIFKIKG